MTFTKEGHWEYNSSMLYIGFEYLGRRFIEIEKQKGIKVIIPTTRESFQIGDAS